MTSPPPAAAKIAVAGHVGDLDAAVAALADPEPAVRATAIGALERLGGLSAAHLAAVLVDSSAAVRCRAIEACACLAGRRAALAPRCSR